MDKENIFKHLIRGGDKDQRFDGLLMECFFEKYFIKKISNLLKVQSYSLGWLHSDDFRNKGARPWFKIQEHNHLNLVDKEFIKALCNAKNKCFVINWEINISKATNIPYIKFFVNQWGMKKDGSGEPFKYNEEYQKESKRFESIFNKEVNDGINQIVENIKRKETSLKNIIYLDSLSSKSIEYLFINRYLMNYGGLFPVDVDMIILKDNELQVLEFKRKYPAKGFYIKNSNFDLYEDYIYKRDEEVIRTINSSSDWSRRSGIEYKCFGLDKSHVKNVSFFNNLGLKYYYIIWDEEMDTLAKLLDTELKPIIDPKLIISIVKPENFLGITYTGGIRINDDSSTRNMSGSYKKGQRAQLAIMYDQFSLLQN